MSRARDLADLGGSADAGGITGRNLIINGAMQIAQRGTVTSVTAGYGGPDRFKLIRAGASAFTLSKDSDAPTGSGFTSSLKIDVTTADASLAADDSVQILQQIEAQNLQRIKKGTSSAESLTLSFWIKSSVTGTYIVEWYEHDNARHINKSYTISSANTWEFKTITIPGDTTGVIANDNGAGIQLSWWLMAGTDYNPVGGTLQTSWGALSQTGRAVGQVNAVNDTANNIYLTGVQLEVGETATPFEHKSFGDELHRCQRYFELLGHATNAGAADTFSLMSLPFNGATNNQWIDIPFMVEKRAAPTSIVAFNGYTVPSATVIGFSTNGMTLYHGAQMLFTKASGGSQGDAVASVSAEL